MANMNLSDLRSWLDEHEKYAGSIKPADPRFDIAQEMLGIIATARDSLRPSADSTANYVQSKEIIEQLGMLRDEAEKKLAGKN
ncbi:MAG: hypothetical protein ACK4N4_11965 [Burkholderiales bacterium]